ncbi:MAG: radical SAM protein [Gemmatimonadales bacterium]|nr:radical SAM protein [Gemmatimonadales bacterium]
MNPIKRIARHARLTSYSYRDMDSPPFLVLFINSICNMKCEHCFYWTSLNKKDDLSKEEIFALSDSLGQIENLNLSGGEPFLRKEFGDICRKFIRTNGVKQIYVPTNGYFTERCIAAIREVLKEPTLDLFVAEISLDGMPEFHDKFRVARHAFKKAMETYDALVELQKEDPRVRVHSISTATDVNMEEIKKLTTYLYERCPQMDHHNLAIIRGDRKNPTLKGPSLKQYEDLYEYIRRLWAPREEGRMGSAVEPMLQWAKTESVKQERQVVPCKAGKISGVVYANGDVGVCEIHKPIGNLRQKTFPEIWHSAEAKALRASIARKECWCTTEVFMWSSIVYQPLPLLEATIKGKVWSKPLPLHPSERLPVSLADGPAPGGEPEPATAEESAY